MIDRGVGSAFGRNLEFVLAARGQAQCKDGDEIENLFHDTCIKGLPWNGLILLQACRKDAFVRFELHNLRCRAFILFAVFFRFQKGTLLSL